MILSILYIEFLVASTTNLVNKDPIKPIVPDPSSHTPEPVKEPVPSPQITSPQPTPAKVEIPIIVKSETVPRRIAVPLETEQIEMTSRSAVTDPSENKKVDDDTRTIQQSRSVVNRNVVIAESSRKVVHGTNNRVVVPSNKKLTNDSDSDLDDLVEQENDTNKSELHFN
jgi:hypothetical protein